MKGILLGHEWRSRVLGALLCTCALVLAACNGDQPTTPSSDLPVPGLATAAASSEPFS